MDKPPSMPRSCGLMFRTLRTRKKLTLASLVQRLRPHTKRFRPADVKFSSDTITDAEHSQQTLYWLADAYAKWSGYPVGFLYLFSRVSCELRDRHFEAARAIAVTLRTLADFVDEHAQPERLRGLQPALFSHRDIAERPADELSGIAYDTVIRYQQHLPNDHRENEGRREDDEIKYIHSEQIIDDARQVRILLELLSKVPPPPIPAAELQKPGAD